MSYTNYVNANRSICCTAPGSCGSVHVQNTATSSNIVCSGLEACFDNQITNDGGAIICGARDSCFSSNISNANHAYCFGHYSCSSIDNIINVTCAGLDSCRGGVINTKGTGDSYDIRFIGSYSGYAANIDCKLSDTCAVLCDGWRACSNLVIICNNNCDVTCASHCPIIVTAHPSIAPSGITAHPSTLRIMRIVPIDTPIHTV
eukprot:252956_1